MQGQARDQDRDRDRPEFRFPFTVASFSLLGQTAKTWLSSQLPPPATGSHHHQQQRQHQQQQNAWFSRSAPRAERLGTRLRSLLEGVAGATASQWKNAMTNNSKRQDSKGANAKTTGAQKIDIASGEGRSRLAQASSNELAAVSSGELQEAGNCENQPAASVHSQNRNPAAGLASPSSQVEATVEKSRYLQAIELEREDGAQFLGGLVDSRPPCIGELESAQANKKQERENHAYVALLNATKQHQQQHEPLSQPPPTGFTCAFEGSAGSHFGGKLILPAQRSPTNLADHSHVHAADDGRSEGSAGFIFQNGFDNVRSPLPMRNQSGQLDSTTLSLQLGSNEDSVNDFDTDWDSAACARQPRSSINPQHQESIIRKGPACSCNASTGELSANENSNTDVNDASPRWLRSSSERRANHSITIIKHNDHDHFRDGGQFQDQHEPAGRLKPETSDTTTPLINNNNALHSPLASPTKANQSEADSRCKTHSQQSANFDNRQLTITSNRNYVDRRASSSWSSIKNIGDQIDRPASYTPINCNKNNLNNSNLNSFNSNSSAKLVSSRGRRHQRYVIQRTSENRSNREQNTPTAEHNQQQDNNMLLSNASASNQPHVCQCHWCAASHWPARLKIVGPITTRPRCRKSEQLKVIRSYFVGPGRSSTQLISGSGAAGPSVVGARVHSSTSKKQQLQSQDNQTGQPRHHRPQAEKRASGCMSPALKAISNRSLSLTEEIGNHHHQAYRSDDRSQSNCKSKLPQVVLALSEASPRFISSSDDDNGRENEREHDNDDSSGGSTIGPSDGEAARRGRCKANSISSCLTSKCPAPAPNHGAPNHSNQSFFPIYNNNNNDANPNQNWSSFSLNYRCLLCELSSKWLLSTSTTTKTSRKDISSSQCVPSTTTTSSASTNASSNANSSSNLAATSNSGNSEPEPQFRPPALVSSSATSLSVASESHEGPASSAASAPLSQLKTSVSMSLPAAAANTRPNVPSNTNATTSTNATASTQRNFIHQNINNNLLVLPSPRQWQQGKKPHRRHSWICR